MKNTHGGANRNQGRKRPPTLPKEGKLYRLPQVLVGKETIEYLRTLPNLSEFVRQAIQEKRERDMRLFLTPVNIKKMNVQSFFNNHYLRTTELREVTALIERGYSFKSAMQKVADDWAAAEEEDEYKSVELEGFLYTNQELQSGAYD